MSSGDMTVVGMVSDRHVVEDIGVIVPKGVAVTIPGPMTLMSKDLHRAISHGALLRIHEPPTAVRASLPKEERDRYEGEIQRLSAQVDALMSRNRLLESQTETLQNELAILRDKDSKLDAILSAIHERPTMIQQVVQQAPLVAATKAPAEEKIDGDAPMFIPSTIKPDNVEERVLVQETTSSSSVAASASKLKALRKNKP